MKYWNFLFGILTVVLMSCGEDDSSSHLGLKFEARSESIDLKSATAGNSVISIEEARLGIVELELEAEYEIEEGEYEKEVEWEMEISGPFQVDLLSGIATPEIILMDIEPGMEYEFECEVSNVLNDGKSVSLSGEVDYNGNNTAFIFETNEDFSIEIEGKQNLDQSANLNDIWIVIVDFDYLFNGISFDNAQLDENDVIVIRQNSNKNLYDKIVDRLETSFEFED